jgi:hypothetical protein
MKTKLLATALLLFVATPAWATTDEILHAAAGLALYQKECGPLPPKTQAFADVIRSVHDFNELDMLNAVMDAQHSFAVTGKEAWCREMRSVEDKAH